MKRSLLLISCSCFISTKLVSSSSTTTNNNNHHETLKSTLEAQQYAQYGPTVFAPGGRLHGVESVAKEAMLLDGSSSSSDSVSCGVFAMHCGGSSSNDGEFVVSLGIGVASPYLHRDEAYYTKEKEDDVNSDSTLEEEGTTYIPLSIEDTSTSTTTITNPISILSPNLIVGAGGKAIDSTILLRRAMEVSLSMFSNDNGGVDWFIHHSLEGINGNIDGCDSQRSRPIMGGAASVDVSSLARRVADMAQSSTQSMGGKYGRMLSSTLLAVGARNPSNNINNSDDDNLILWRVDPTGQFWRLHASAVGRGGMKIEAELLQHVHRWKKLEQKQQQNDDKEEDDVHISREDIRTYLGSLTVKEAIEVATDCFVKGIMSSNMREKQSSSREDILDRKLFEIGLRKRIQAVVLRSNTSGKATSIEVV